MERKSLGNKQNEITKAYSDAFKRGSDVNHVYRKADGKGWAVKRRGASKASGIYNTQGEALKVAKSKARRKNSSVVVHGISGKIKNVVRPR